MNDTLRRGGLVALAAILAGGLLLGAMVLLSRGSGSSAAMCRAEPVAERVLPSVVTILVGTETGTGNGSGELIRRGGFILTNDHVIAAGAASGDVTVRYVDGHTAKASIVGRDIPTDLAVVKADDAATGFPLIRVGSSAALRVGQPVVALGSPLGLHSTVTTGIVSALDRFVQVPVGDDQTAHLLDALQTDAAINPGNSGGPLVDCSGAMVGVNTATATQGDAGSVGLGFAIPADLAAPLADQLIDTGRANHPTFGLEALALGTGAASGTARNAGLLVTTVEPGGPAAQAGIRPGDVITQVDGEPATRVDQLVLLTLRKEAGDTVQVDYSRQGEPGSTEVTLADVP